MRLKSFILLGLVLSLTGLVAWTNSKPEQKDLIVYKSTEDYKNEWTEVDSLIKIGQDKTAAQKVEQILNKAEKSQNYNQVYKATLYIARLSNSFTEESLEKTIIGLEQKTKEYNYPLSAIFHSTLGSIYQNYYQQNSWKFNQRTEIQGEPTDDIKTWDLKTIVKRIQFHYDESLIDSEQLKRTPINYFEPILTEQKINYAEEKEVQRFLYDLLVNRAIDFYSSGQASLTDPIDVFTIEDSVVFSSNEEFVKAVFQTTDTFSNEWKALKLYQEWTVFLLKEDNLTALTDATIKRLQFAKTYYQGDGNDAFYFRAIVSLHETLENNPESARTAFEIANYYKQTYDSDTASIHKNKLKEAAELCEEHIKLYSKSYGAVQCRALLSQLNMPSHQIELESAQLPNTPMLFKATWRNVSTMYYRIVDSPFGIISENMNYNEQKRKLLDSRMVNSWAINFSGQEDLRQHTTEFAQKGLPTGHYYLMSSSNADFSIMESISFTEMWVSEISFIQQNNANGGLEVYVLSRKNGHPIGGVDLEVYQDRSYGKYAGRIGKSKTDANGFVALGNAYNRSVSIVFKNGKDSLYSQSIYSYNNYRSSTEKWNTRVNFFTDRAIYRPGQTVYFKGIVIDSKAKEVKLNTNYSSTVELMDVNYKKVASIDVKANQYGSFSGSFQLPVGGLTGHYQLKTNNGQHGFSVEEYKRPQFEVKFDPVKGNFKLNDSVAVVGKAIAYSGSNLTDAEVSYRVTRREIIPYYHHYGWRRFPPSQNNEAEIAKGKVSTNAAGEFEVKFLAKAPTNSTSTFTYEVVVDVMDINGETQSSTTSVSIGTKSYQLQVDLGEEIEVNQLKGLTFKTTNYSNEPVVANIEYSIELLKASEQVYKQRYWEMPEQIQLEETAFRGEFPHFAYRENEIDPSLLGIEKRVVEAKGSSNELLQLPSELASGTYRLNILATDENGDEIKQERYFTVFSLKDKCPAVASVFWTKQLNSKVEVGDKAQFVIGSRATDTKVLYELVLGDKVLKKEWITLKKEQKVIEVDVKDEFRGGFRVNLLMVYDNRSFNKSMEFMVPYSNKQLNVKLSTFRNVTEPGNKEAWSLTVTDVDKKSVQAEVLASMYDQSLDVFQANSWNFFPYSNNYSRSNWQSDQYFRRVSAANYFEPMGNNLPSSLNYKGLNFFGFEGDGQYYYRNSYVQSDAVMSSSPNRKFSADDIAYMAVRSGKGAKEEDIEEAESTSQTLKITPSIRSDFRETAFFYPHLETKEDGTVDFTFTMPDALTRYKFMAMAHTTDLKIGTTLEEIVAQKELMVMPNPPRFFREGDTLVFKTKMANISEKEQEVAATIAFFDALTMKPINLLANDKADKKMTISSKGNEVVSWQIAIPKGLQAVTYKIIGESKTHSDGEERTIPVLTNRMLVTEALPLPMNGKGSKQFKFDKLVNNTSSTLTNERFTIEYTSNPAWYAIQALPYLMEYPYECAEQTFSRLYANTIATHIANSDPKIKRVFEIWRQYQPDALLSNLEKNQELKALVIEETPWLRNAKDESERKRRLGELFQLDKMERELSRATKKLVQMQYASGAWPWFDGGRENRYITQHIVSGFGHLKQLGMIDFEKNPELRQMLDKAIAYLDAELKADYHRQIYDKADLSKKQISSFQIQYFYARSFFIEKEISTVNKVAFDYYYKQSKLYWLDYSLKLRGMIALSAHRYKDVEVAKKIMAAAKDIAIYNDEMGMYWKDNRRGYYWNQAPIETQALMIEAFDEVLDDQASVELLKIWLLKQKQTQDWKTTKATADACYALLLKGTDLLTMENTVSLIVGDQQLDPANDPSLKTEAGTGYFKKSWSGGEVSPKMGNITVKKTNDGVAWGAAYWQYFEDLDKITFAETPLKLKKELFVEVATNSGKQLKKITATEPIKLGDKVIVRVELRSDRDLEFVHLKDMRASGFEPINVMSSYKYQDGLGYYESTKDAATNFFISYLRKGTYVFEYELRANITGQFSNGITQVQCMYAPEFTAHSNGVRVTIK
jgi:hypothetical protein